MESLSKELMDIRDDFSCTVKEGEALYNLAMKANEAIVEIGSWKGYSTVWLAKGSKEGNKVPIYAIDTFEGDIHSFVTGEGETFKIFINNIDKKGVREIVIPKVMKSVDAVRDWVKPIDLLFIDGDHDEIDIDFERWYPHLVNGGIMALHDTVYWHDMKPYKVAIKELYKSGKFTDIRRVGCLTYARKVTSLSWLDKFKNDIALYKRYVYQFLIPYYTKCLVLVDTLVKKVK